MTVVKRAAFGQGGIKASDGDRVAKYIHCPCLSELHTQGLRAFCKQQHRYTCPMQNALSFCMLSTGNKNPGPNEYSPDERFVRSTSPSFTFKGVTAKDHRVRNPAPGHYNPGPCTETTSGHSTAPAITMSQRLAPPKSHSRQPAPGEYETYKPYLQMSRGLPVSFKFRYAVSCSIMQQDQQQCCMQHLILHVACACTMASR